MRDEKKTGDDDDKDDKESESESESESEESSSDDDAPAPKGKAAFMKAPAKKPEPPKVWRAGGWWVWVVASVGGVAVWEVSAHGEGGLAEG